MNSIDFLLSMKERRDVEVSSDSINTQYKTTNIQYCLDSSIILSLMEYLLLPKQQQPQTVEGG